MKALLCGKCFDIRALDPEGAWTSCRCGNTEARWQDPRKGTVRVRAQDRGTARILGMNNSFLYKAFAEEHPPQDDEWRKAHEEATSAPGYIFDKAFRGCWACIVGVGETGDISWEPEQ